MQTITGTMSGATDGHWNARNVDALQPPAIDVEAIEVAPRAEPKPYLRIGAQSALWLARTYLCLLVALPVFLLFRTPETVVAVESDLQVRAIATSRDLQRSGASGAAAKQVKSSKFVEDATVAAGEVGSPVGAPEAMAVALDPAGAAKLRASTRVEYLYASHARFGRNIITGSLMHAPSAHRERRYKRGASRPRYQSRPRIVRRGVQAVRKVARSTRRLLGRIF